MADDNRSGPTDSDVLFEQTKHRAVDDIRELMEEIQANVEVVDGLESAVPPTATLSESDFERYLDAEDSPDGQVAADRLNAFLNSLWQLYQRVENATVDTTQSDALSLFTTYRILLDDWDEFERQVNPSASDRQDDDIRPDGGVRGGKSMRRFFRTIRSKLNRLSNKIIGLLSSISTIDSWELNGKLSGSVPGFAKGEVGVAITFT